MPQTDIDSTTVGNTTSAVEDITIATADTDGPTGSGDTTWVVPEWSKWYGVYKKIPQVRQVINLRVEWVAGAGFTADTRTEVILDRINFLPTLKNMLRTRRICGIAYSEIIRDPKKGTLLGLKSLNPSTIQIVVGKNGLLKEYRQISRTDKAKAFVKFKPIDLFVLKNPQVADEIGAQGDIEAISEIVSADNEAFFIQKEITRHFARPKMLVEVDTDDQTQIDALIVKWNAATNLTNTCGNVFYPKDTINPTPLVIPPQALSATLPWRDALQASLHLTMNTPQVLSGGGAGQSEANGKVQMMAHSQSVKSEALEIENEVWRQLFFRIKLGEAVSLQPDLLSDVSKDGSMQQMDIQPAEIAPPKPEVAE